MNVSEMAKQIGREVLVRFESVQFKMRIVDVRTAYGKLQFQVMPLHGQGQQWVEAGRISEGV